jgi:hypothetical protein
LEKAFVFDEPEDPLFDLAELKLSPSKMGKKAAHVLALKEAAILNQEQAGDGDLPSLVDSAFDLLGQVPFLNSDQENSALKLVENFT